MFFLIFFELFLNMIYITLTNSILHLHNTKMEDYTATHLKKNIIFATI